MTVSLGNNNSPPFTTEDNPQDEAIAVDGSTEIDLQALAEAVYRLFQRELRWERERLGRYR